MKFCTGDLQELPHLILGQMVKDAQEGGSGPWWISVLHGPSHMESVVQGFLIAQEGHEITIDRTDADAEPIGVKVILHEDWIHRIEVP